MELDFYNLPKTTRIHFIGIGGISMSALAEILVFRGFAVSGSDISSSLITKRLEKLGLLIKIGHTKENIANADIIIYTAAIASDNPEIVYAKELGIPLYERPVLLGAIMRSYQYPIAVSGTHGKTTTTSMLSHIFIEAALDPTILVGGNLNAIDGNLRLGANHDYFIAEACEYHESFLEFNPLGTIILNVEADHLDYFEDLAHIISSFNKFAKIIPKTGVLVANGDDVNAIAATSGVSCKVVSYGTNPAFDYCVSDISFSNEGYPAFNIVHSGEILCRIKLSVPGLHNMSNALAAAALSLEFGAPIEAIVKGLESFSGTDRRFQQKGERNGVTVVDDYAHHPTEIKATLAATKNFTKGHIFCVFQPHTYTRTRLLLEEFKTAFINADTVLVSDIYAAREKDTGLISSKILTDEINSKTNNAIYIKHFDEIVAYIDSHAKAGDIVLTMGAGDIYKVGESFLEQK